LKKYGLLRNIEKSDGTVIFSLERALSGGTKLTLELANKLGKPVLRIYDTRKERGSMPFSLMGRLLEKGSTETAGRVGGGEARVGD
jgi:hypothetical protein